MKKYILCFIALCQLQSSFAQKFEWLTHASARDASIYCPIALASSGAIYTLVHTNANFITIQSDTIASLVPKADGVALIKLDSNGNFKWGKMVNSDGGAMTGEKIAVDKEGSVYVSFNFSTGGSVHLADTIFPITAAAVIIKFNSSGNFIRARTFISGTAPRISCLGTDLYVGVNNMIMKLDSMLTTVWTDVAPTGTVAFDGSGSQRADLFVQKNGQLVASAIELINFSGPVLFGGDTIPFHIGNFDETAVLKMDTSGHLKQAIVISQSSGLQPAIRAVGLDGDGRIFAGVSNLNSQIVFASDTLQNTMGTAPYCAVFKWNYNGQPLWAAGLYPTVGAQLNDLVVNTKQDVLISGQSSLMSIDGAATFPGPANRYFLIKFDSDKNFEWYEAETEAPGNSSGDGIALRNDSEYIVGGSTPGTTTYRFGCLSYPATTSTNFVGFVDEQKEIYPQASFTFINDNLVYDFIDQSLNATAWHWTFGDGDTSNLQNPSHTFGGAGIYPVTLTAYYKACTSDSSITIIIQFTNGIQINSVSNVKIYPIPARDKTTIDFSLKKEDNISIDLLSVTGNIVRQFNPGRLSSGNHRTELNLKTLASGIYFVKLRTSEGSIVSKLIKE